MRIYNGVRKSLTRLIILFIAFASLLIIPLNPAKAQDARDCDANAVMRCGALTIDELKTKYNLNSGNTQAIYRQFGINSVNDFNGMVLGSVNTSNQVMLGNKVIATNALTAGRQNMPGSTPILNGLAYQRPPSVSFSSSPLSAFIKMNGSQFQFAVITSCGNPVKAQPIPVPVPKPVPKTPNFTIEKTVSQHGANQFTKSISASNGATVDFKIVITNTGNQTLTNIKVNDDLPGSLIPVEESLSSNHNFQTDHNSTSSSTTVTSLEDVLDDNSGSSTTVVTANDSNNNSISDSDEDLSNLFNSFTVIDRLEPGKSVTITFSATIEGDIDACTIPFVNVVTAQPKETASRSSQASVKVCETESPTPIVPATTTPVQPVAETPVTPLINTGNNIAAMVGIFGLVSTGAAIFHQIFMRLNGIATKLLR